MVNEEMPLLDEDGVGVHLYSRLGREYDDAMENYETDDLNENKLKKDD